MQLKQYLYLPLLFVSNIVVLCCNLSHNYLSYWWFGVQLSWSNLWLGLFSLRPLSYLIAWSSKLLQPDTVALLRKPLSVRLSVCTFVLYSNRQQKSSKVQI